MLLWIRCICKSLYLKKKRLISVTMHQPAQCALGLSFKDLVSNNKACLLI